MKLCLLPSVVTLVEPLCVAVSTTKFAKGSLLQGWPGITRYRPSHKQCGLQAPSAGVAQVQQPQMLQLEQTDELAPRHTEAGQRISAQAPDQASVDGTPASQGMFLVTCSACSEVLEALDSSFAMDPVII